jgi:hypothetical protein
MLNGKKARAFATWSVARVQTEASWSTCLQRDLYASALEEFRVSLRRGQVYFECDEHQGEGEPEHEVAAHDGGASKFSHPLFFCSISRMQNEESAGKH